MPAPETEHVEYHKFSRREGCTYEGCPAKRYYIADGKRFCRLGHEQEGFRQVHADEDDFKALQGHKTRRKREENERVETVYHGREANELYLKCYQLVLWKQVRWLVDMKGLPNDLETVVRDLWAVWLRGVKGLGDEGGAFGSDAAEFSSTSEHLLIGIDDDSTGWGRRMQRRNGRLKRSEKMPRLIDSLAMCYLGMLLIRLPVSLGELHNWAERDEITFVRAIKEIPREMRVRLPAGYHAALETRSALREGQLHKVVTEMVICYKQRFDVIFPPLNAPLIFFKHVRDLCLPLDIYVAARRLGKILDLGFSFMNNLVRHRFMTYPESQIMSLIVIATKLCQPFDDIVRVPESAADPTGLRLHWGKWQEIMGEKFSEGLKRGQEIMVTDVDILKMNERKLDDYLNWYRRTWIDEDEPKLPHQLLDLFPITDRAVDGKDDKPNVVPIPDRLKQMIGSLVWQTPISTQDEQPDPGINRPGSFYWQYRRVDDLPDIARAFYIRAAENAGLSLEMLVREVFLMECQLQKWMAAEKRLLLAEQEQETYDEMDGISSAEPQLVNDSA